MEVDRSSRQDLCTAVRKGVVVRHGLLADHRQELDCGFVGLLEASSAQLLEVARSRAQDEFVYSYFFVTELERAIREAVIVQVAGCVSLSCYSIFNVVVKSILSHFRHHLDI